jgi:hypothetical protein
MLTVGSISVMSQPGALATTSGTKATQTANAPKSNNAAKAPAGGVTTKKSTAAAPTPFSTYLDLTPAEMTRNRDLVETKLAACMKKQGFTYIARTSEPTTTNQADNPTDAFKLAHGYGIADSLDLLAKPPAQTANPNDGVRNKMSVDQRKAYDTALFGKELVEQAASPTKKAVTPGGCQGESTKFLERRTTLLNTFAPTLRAFEESFEKDPRVVTARAEWSGCMAKSGYRFPHPSVVAGAIAARFEVSELTSQTAQGTSDAKPNTGGRPARATVPPATVKQIRDEELAIAKIDVACSRGINDKVLKTRIELERAFIVTHQTEFDAIRSAKDS